MRYTWSNPLEGVSHIREVPRLHQITLEDHGSFVQVYHMILIPPGVFEPRQQAEFSTVAEAQKWGEKIASQLR
jgi:hypothetical protein